MKKSNKTDTVVRMEYGTYVHLKYLLENDMKRLKSDYQTSCNFMPTNLMITPDESVIMHAHTIFGKKYAKLKGMLEQLHAAAAATYKDHPNPEMRKFWSNEER